MHLAGGWRLMTPAPILIATTIGWAQSQAPGCGWLLCRLVSPQQHTRTDLTTCLTSVGGGSKLPSFVAAEIVSKGKRYGGSRSLGRIPLRIGHFLA